RAGREKPVQPLEAHTTSGPLILVVDDDEDLRMAIVEVLQEGGYRVLECRHGAEALEVLRRGERPALLLVDLVMPVMEGAHLRDGLRDDPGLAHLRLVFLSAQRRTPPDCAPIYFKPISSDGLLSLVAEHVSHH